MFNLGPQSVQQTNNPGNYRYLIDTFSHSLSKEFNSKLLIPQFYLQDKLSISQVASRLEVSRDYVRNTLVRLGIPIRSERSALDLCGQTPYGWKKKIGRIVPHVYEQRVLARIADARREGQSLRKIALQLTHEGIPTKTGRWWHAKTMSRILERNEILMKEFNNGRA